MLTDRDFASIYEVIEDSIRKRGQSLMMSKVIKVNPDNHTIFTKETGDQPIPLFYFGRAIRYYDTQLGTPTISTPVTVSSEINYKEVASNVNITGVGSANHQTVLTFDSITWDGATAVFFEFHSAAIALSGAASQFMIIAIKDVTTGNVGQVIGQLGIGTTAMGLQAGFLAKSSKITPPAGAKQYSIVAWEGVAGTCTFSGGAGGTAGYKPITGRIVRADPVVTITPTISVPTSIVEKNGKVDPVNPKVGDIALIAFERGTIRLPRCVGILQSKNFVMSTLDDA